MTQSLKDQMLRIADSMDERQDGNTKETPETTKPETSPIETIHIHYFPDGIVILKEEEHAQVVDSTPVVSQKSQCYPHTLYVVSMCWLLLPRLRFRCTALPTRPLRP